MSKLAQAIWLMLAVATCWVAYLLASNYGSCRADGTGKIGCLIGALIVSGFEAIVFAVVTVVKLLRLVLP